MTGIMQVLAAALIVVLAAWIINRYMGSGKTQSVVNLVLMLIVVGMALWAINSYLPMAGPINALLNIVVVVAMLVRILQVMGLWGSTVNLWNRVKSYRPKPDNTQVPREPAPARPAAPAPEGRPIQAQEVRIVPAQDVKIVAAAPEKREVAQPEHHEEAPQEVHSGPSR